MKTPILMLIAGVSLSATLVLAGLSEENPFWHADWPTAQRIAKRTNKPIFVIFVCRH